MSAMLVVIAVGSGCVAIDAEESEGSAGQLSRGLSDDDSGYPRCYGYGNKAPRETYSWQEYCAFQTCRYGGHPQGDAYDCSGSDCKFECWCNGNEYGPSQLLFIQDCSLVRELD